MDFLMWYWPTLVLIWLHSVHAAYFYALMPAVRVRHSMPHSMCCLFKRQWSVACTMQCLLMALWE